MIFFITAAGVMALLIVIIHKLSGHFGCELPLSSLIICGVCAIIINFLIISVTPFLTSTYYYTAGLMIIFAAFGTTCYNKYSLSRKIRLADGSTLASAELKAQPEQEGETDETDKTIKAAAEAVIAPADASISDTGAGTDADVGTAADSSTAISAGAAASIDMAANTDITINSDAEMDINAEADIYVSADTDVSTSENQNTSISTNANTGEKADIAEAVPEKDMQQTAVNISAVPAETASHGPKAPAADTGSKTQPAAAETAKEARTAPADKVNAAPGDKLKAVQAANKKRRRIKSASGAGNARRAKASVKSAAKAAVTAASPDKVKTADNAAVYTAQKDKSRQAAAVRIPADTLHVMSAMTTMDQLLDFAFEQNTQKKPQVALTAYEMALTRYHDDSYAPFIVVSIANIHKEQGDYSAAISSIQEAMDLPALQENESIKKQFRDTLSYLKITEDVLQKAGLGDISFKTIPREHMSQIESIYNSRKSR